MYKFIKNYKKLKDAFWWVESSGTQAHFDDEKEFFYCQLVNSNSKLLIKFFAKKIEKKQKQLNGKKALLEVVKNG